VLVFLRPVLPTDPTMIAAPRRAGTEARPTGRETTDELLKLFLLGS
jgi:hypothetical protein